MKPQYCVYRFLYTRDLEVTQTSSLLRFQHLYLWARGCVWCSISFYFAFLFYILIFTRHITHSSLSVNTPELEIASVQFLLSLLFLPDWWTCWSPFVALVTFGLTGTLQFCQFLLSELPCLIIVVLKFNIINFDCSLDLLIFLWGYWDRYVMGEYIKKKCCSVHYSSCEPSFINAG